jgi:hypothetical protein
MSSETWKKIRGFPDYEISSLGRIRSHAQRCPRILKTDKKVNGAGYESACLGARYTTGVHQLVAIAFCGTRRGREVNHKNGNKRDNRAINLEWVTSSENKYHSIKIGLRKPYKRIPFINGPHKLSRIDCDMIKAWYATGEFGMRKIAKAFGVSKTTVQYTLRRQYD